VAAVVVVVVQVEDGELCGSIVKYISL